MREFLVNFRMYLKLLKKSEDDEEVIEKFLNSIFSRKVMSKAIMYRTQELSNNITLDQLANKVDELCIAHESVRIAEKKQVAPFFWFRLW